MCWPKCWYNTKCIQFFIDPIGWSARRQVRFAPQRIRQQRALDIRAVTGLPASTCLLFALQTGHYCFAFTVVPCVSPNNILLNKCIKCTYSNNFSKSICSSPSKTASGEVHSDHWYIIFYSIAQDCEIQQNSVCWPGKNKFTSNK